MVYKDEFLRIFALSRQDGKYLRNESVTEIAHFEDDVQGFIIQQEFYKFM